MTTRAAISTTSSAPGRMPSGFVVWATAAAGSAMGSSVMSFGIAWCATGIDARLAGVIVTLVVAPRVVLLMLGGVAADRVGARRVMIAGDALMCAAALLLAAVTQTSGVAVWSLLLVSLIGGIVDAFYLPAAGAIPRLFLGDAQLPRGMALVSGVRQVAMLAGPPLGAVIVMSVGLAASAAANAVTFAVVLVVLWVMRPPREVPPRTDRVGLAGEMAQSIREIWGDRLVRGMLGPVGLLACSVLPMVDLGTPLLVRDRGWGAGVAGLIETSWFVGTFTITVVIARIGTHPRPGLVAGLAPLLAGAAAAVMVIGRTPTMAVAGSLLVGMGVAACTSHIAPVFLMATPSDQVSRFQSVFVLVQMAPVLVTNNAFGLLSHSLGAPAVFVAAAVMMAGSGAWLLASRTVRQATTPHTTDRAGAAPTSHDSV